jgi:probable HAF family extracellular repeat protein
MKRKVKLIVLAFIWAVAAPAHRAIGYYQLIDLGTLGGTSSAAYSINNNGQIVGYAYDSSGIYRATLFDPTGGGNNIDLGNWLGEQSVASSINDNGQIVGRAEDSSGYSRATLFDPTGGGNNIDLGTLGGNLSAAGSINDNGQIVGWAMDNLGGLRAALFAPNINLRTLFKNPPFGDYGLSMAYSINNQSQIVGYSEAEIVSGDYIKRVRRAVLFDPTGRGNNIDLGILDGWWSRAYFISDRGQIVGEADNRLRQTRATLFDPTGAGNNIDLGTLPGYDMSSATAINDAGQIVGYAVDSSWKSRATLFDPTGGGNNIDLNTLIDPALGWTLQYATSINDNGWIVGYGTNHDGYTRAYILIPEPATLSLFALAGMALLRKRRK